MIKKFLYSFLFIAIGFFAADRIGGRVMYGVSLHTNDVLGPKLRYLRDSIGEEVVLLGASRCHHHYLPSIISDTLGMSVYNAGVGGSNNIFSHYIVLQHILNRYVPKVVCLEVMTSDYSPSEDSFSTISFFAPLFGCSESADSIFRLAGNYWSYKISHLYRYNAKASSNILGLVFDRQKGNDNGYIPLPEPRIFPTTPQKEENVNNIDSLKLEYMQRFVDCCKQKGIRIIFMVSPKFTYTDACHYDVLEHFAKKNDIAFLNYHTTGLYLEKPEYFKDVSHLWDKGARRYSSVFANDLKRILQTNGATDSIHTQELPGKKKEKKFY